MQDSQRAAVGKAPNSMRKIAQIGFAHNHLR
jgi:hypothetical protein